jgi:hypothetical protein
MAGCMRTNGRTLRNKMAAVADERRTRAKLVTTETYGTGPHGRLTRTRREYANTNTHRRAYLDAETDRARAKVFTGIVDGFSRTTRPVLVWVNASERSEGASVSPARQSSAKWLERVGAQTRVSTTTTTTLRRRRRLRLILRRPLSVRHLYYNNIQL